jgi:hypothetical protein
METNERKTITARIRYETGMSARAFCEEHGIDYDAFHNALRSLSGIRVDSQGYKALAVLKERGFISEAKFNELTKSPTPEEAAKILQQKAANMKERKKIKLKIRERLSMSLTEYAKSRNIDLPSLQVYLGGVGSGERKESKIGLVKLALEKDGLLEA